VLRSTKTFVDLLNASVGDSVAEVATHKILEELLENYALARDAIAALEEAPEVSSAGLAAAESGRVSLELATLSLELIMIGHPGDRAR
jgi:hypothetical protein